MEDNVLYSNSTDLKAKNTLKTQSQNHLYLMKQPAKLTHKMNTL
jgi:hypothetical protein